MRTGRPIKGFAWEPDLARARTRALPARRVSELRFGLAYFAVCVALCVASLSFAERLEQRTVAHWEQADASLLMSCAEEPSSSNEPLWCADRDSPHCTRSAPAPQSSDPWVGPMYAACEAPLTLPPQAALGVKSAHTPAELLGYAQADGERLERPPRRG
jgi:hypothetical protein